MFNNDAFYLFICDVQQVCVQQEREKLSSLSQSNATDMRCN